MPEPQEPEDAGHEDIDPELLELYEVLEFKGEIVPEPAPDEPEPVVLLKKKDPE